MTQAQASLLILSQRYLDGLLDTSISLLEIHKLMFFLQEAGEPLQLNYKKGIYGPLRDILLEDMRTVVTILRSN